MYAKSRKKVLIADDEPAVRKLIRRILDKDYDVIEVRNGTEAVNMACSQRPDVVLMDVMMPEADGLSACLLCDQGRPDYQRNPCGDAHGYRP